MSLRSITSLELIAMAVRSKWQSLPTEAINPSSLGIDKLAADDIVDLMVNEDRKMLAAVQRERERIAVGIEMIAGACVKAAASSSSAPARAAGSASSSRPKCRRRSAPIPSWCRR